SASTTPCKGATLSGLKPLLECSRDLNPGLKPGAIYLRGPNRKVGDLPLIIGAEPFLIENGEWRMRSSPPGKEGYGFSRGVVEDVRSRDVDKCGPSPPSPASRLPLLSGRGALSGRQLCVQSR